MRTVRGDGFTVEMPGKPQRERSPVSTGAGTVQASVLAVKNHDEAFLVSASPLPPGANVDLKEIIYVGAATVGGLALHVTATTYQGYPTRDARVPDVAARGGESTVFFRAILVKKGGQRFVYRMQYVHNGANAQPTALYRRFLASLRFR
jgi:hypothetical protein